MNSETRPNAIELLPSPCLERDGDLTLELIELQKANVFQDLVPAYIFAMKHSVTGVHMGRIGFRVGQTEQIRLYAGHFGYAVDWEFRGNHYAERSCRLLLPLAKLHGMTELWITCNPENVASRRTLERLGAELIEIIDVPRSNGLYIRGETRKCRFRLPLTSDGL